MDKPFFYIGAMYLTTLILLLCTGKAMAVTLLILNLVSAAVFLLPGRDTWKNNLVFFLIFLFCAEACMSFLIADRIEVSRSEAFRDTSVHIEGYVLREQPDSVSGAHRAILRVTSLTDPEDPTRKRPYRCTVRFSSKDYDLRINDAVSFDGNTYRLGEQDRGMQRYYQSQRLFLGVYPTKDLEYTDLKTLGLNPLHRTWRSLLSRISALQSRIAETLSSRLSDPYASILTGMLLGDRAGMEASDTETFRLTGVLHLFAVSGFHCALWTGIFQKVLLRSGVSARTTSTACLAFLIFFSALTGFSRSCLRACVMLSVFYLGRLLLERPEPLNSLGLGVLCLCLGNPFSGGDPSVLLTAAATFGVLTLYPKAMQGLKRDLRFVRDRNLKRVLEDGASVVLLSVCCSAVTLPVVMLTFGGISLVAPLTNLLISAAASGSIALAGVGVLVSGIPVVRLFAPWMFWLSGMGVRYMRAVCGWLAGWRLAYLPLGDKGIRSTILLLMGYLSLCGIAYVLWQGEDWKLRQNALVMSVILLCTSCLSGQILERDTVTVDFPAVGNGSCAVVCFDGSAAVIGCGGDYRTGQAVEAVLSGRGIRRVSAVLVPRSEKTESGAAEELISTWDPDTVVLPQDWKDPPERECSFLDDYTVSLFPEVSVSMHGDYAVLTASGMRILLLFRPGAAPAGIAADLVYSRSNAENTCGASFVVISREAPETGDSTPYDTAPYLLTAPGGVTVSVRHGKYRVERGA